MIVSLSGGLGNQMFQYAFGISVAARKHEELFFDKQSFNGDKLRYYELNTFGCALTFAYPEAPFLCESDYGMKFIPQVYDVGPGFTFKGYWQTEKYFDPDMVREDFAVPNGSPNKACEEMAQRILTFPNSCFVGVRRGDYLWPERINYHGVLPIRYYIEAERRMPYDTKYFVFSDDIPWCRRNLRDDSIIVDVNGPDEKAWDIWLMSLCSHAIIANSTFHWWGAWLGPDRSGGTIVAPKAWFVNGIANEVVPARWTTI